MSAEMTTTKKPDELTREHTRSGVVYRPHVDIVELSDELLVLADMPGVRAENVDINFEQGSLTIRGTVEPRQKEHTGYTFQEYGIGDFYREFQVSESIAADKISAELSDGVLTLHLPKVEAVKPRKIAVTCG